MGKTKKTENSLLLVVDGENLLHRSYHKFLGFKSKEGLPSGAIYGFYKSLHSLIFRFQPTHLLITFDNGRSDFRTKVHPEYKGDRNKIGMDYESLQKQKKAIMKLARILNLAYIFDKHKTFNYEGDDYIALACHKFMGNVILVSSDKDFCQLVSRRVKQFNPGKDMMITVSNCKEVMGYTPEECVDFLSLLGDKSDNIPGFPGIGEKKARQFLDNHGSIFNYLFQDVDTEGSGPNMAQLSAIYDKNKKLIDLRYFIKEHPLESIPIKSPKSTEVNKGKLYTFCNKYSLESFQVPQFIKTFNIKPYEH